MLTNLTDKELWTAITDSDRDALAALFQRYYFYLVKSGIVYCQDTELAKDAVNDVFVSLWQRRQKLAAVDNVKAYLHTMCRHQLYGLLRNQAKDKDRREQWNETLPQQEPSYEDILVGIQVQEEQKEKLRRALQKLSPRQKEYLHLKYFEGLSYEQVALKTGQTTKTVYNTTYEAIKVLRKEIKL